MKKAFLSKPNINTSQTGEGLDLTFGQLGHGKHLEPEKKSRSGKKSGSGEQSGPGRYSGPRQHSGRRHRNKLHGRGLGLDAWIEQPSEFKQHPQKGASINRSESSQELIDQYIQEREYQLSFPDPPCPLSPDTALPNIQSSVPQLSGSGVPIYDPALGGTRASTHGQQNAGATASNEVSSQRVPEAASSNVRAEASQTGNSASQPLLGVTNHAVNSHGGFSNRFGTHRVDNTGASMLGMHPLPGLLTTRPPPPGIQPPGVPPPNSPYVNGKYGLPTNSYPGNVLSPHSIPIYQQSKRDGFTPRVHLPQNGYQPSSVPPFRPQIAPIVNKTSHKSFQPRSQQYGTAVSYRQHAANNLHTPGSANGVVGSQTLPPASLAQHTPAFSIVPPSPVTASKSTDLVSKMVAERAATDPDLEALKRIVTNGEATPEELKKFQAHIDEPTQLKYAREAVAQALQPPTQPSPPSATVPAPVNRHETTRPAPIPSPTSTPARTTPAPPTPAARPEPQSQPQPQTLRLKDAPGFLADADLQGGVFRADSQMQSGGSGEEAGQDVSGGVRSVGPSCLNQHMAPAGANQSNEEESRNSMEENINEVCRLLSKPPSPNENSATSNRVTQTTTSKLRSLGNSEVPPQAAKENIVHSQTESRQASQENPARVPVSSALSAHSTWGNKDISKPSMERPLTNAELLARKLAKAEIAEENDSKENGAMDQAAMPPPSDATQWPSLGESRLMGGKSKKKKGIKDDPKVGNMPGPKPNQGPDPESGLGPGLTVLSACLHTIDNKVDWNTIRDSKQMKTEFKFDIASRSEQNANPKEISYFASNGSAPLAKEKDSLAKLFEKYREPTDEEDKTGVNGTMQYLQDLGLNLESAEILVPLEIVQAPALAELSKDAFVEGWKTVGADTIAKQRAYVLGQLKQLSVDMTLFKRVYRHTFVCSRDPGQKALPLENALIYWEMIFNPPGKPWVTGTGQATTNWTDLWIEFLKANWTKTVNKDMWNQTFEFFQKTMQDETLSFWSEDGAWPGVIDEFVAYVKEKRGDLPDTMETD